MQVIFDSLLAVPMLEWAAIFFTALCIWLAGQNNVFTWPTGIVAVLLYAVIFYEVKLYAEVLLQFFFVGTSLYGWWVWRNKKTGVEPIKSVSVVTLAFLLALAAISTIGYASVLHMFTDASAPVLDSTVLMFSILGQLLLMSRYKQNWPVWILVNTVSVPLYFTRELYPTAIMYSIFWVHAWYAWWKWDKEMKEQHV
jgi:nicotinamide mononucleotide transporter